MNLKHQKLKKKYFIGIKISIFKIYNSFTEVKKKNCYYYQSTGIRDVFYYITCLKIEIESGRVNVQNINYTFILTNSMSLCDLLEYTFRHRSGMIKIQLIHECRYR